MLKPFSNVFPSNGARAEDVRLPLITLLRNNFKSSMPTDAAAVALDRLVLRKVGKVGGHVRLVAVSLAPSLVGRVAPAADGTGENLPHRGQNAFALRLWDRVASSAPCPEKRADLVRQGYPQLIPDVGQGNSWASHVAAARRGNRLTEHLGKLLELVAGPASTGGPMLLDLPQHRRKLGHRAMHDYGAMTNRNLIAPHRRCANGRRGKLAAALEPKWLRMRIININIDMNIKY